MNDWDFSRDGGDVLSVAAVPHGDRPIFALGRRSVAKKKGRRRTTVVGIRLVAIMVAATAFMVTGLLVWRNSVKICITLL
ncbi:hypothetical protein ACLOJK_035743 [Asimina triloba]